MNKFSAQRIIRYSMLKHEKQSILHQYNKTKLFRIYRLPCRQTEIKLLAKSIKTSKSITG